MKLFIIHTIVNGGRAKKKLNRISQDSSLDINPIFFDNSGSDQWKEHAMHAIKQSNAVIVFNRNSCMESENTKWAIEHAKQAGKEIIELNDNKENLPSILKLESLQ